MAKKVILILGHPSQNSLCNALIDSCQKGAESSDAICKSIVISELNFNSNLSEGYKNREALSLEDDVLNSQQLITWADHIVMADPTWRGSMPALQKALSTGYSYQDLPSNIIRKKTFRKTYY